MSIEYGSRVKTPTGEEGSVAQEKVNETLHLLVWTGRGNRALKAYPVLLDSGEVRFYKADALTELESDLP